MEYIALCASLFLKNALISERKFVTLCTGIGLSFLLFCHYKDTHFLQQTEIPMPFLCTNTSYYCQLAKLEVFIISLRPNLIGSKFLVLTTILGYGEFENTCGLYLYILFAYSHGLSPY